MKHKFLLSKSFLWRKTKQSLQLGIHFIIEEAKNFTYLQKKILLSISYFNYSVEVESIVGKEGCRKETLNHFFYYELQYLTVKTYMVSFIVVQFAEISVHNPWQGSIMEEQSGGKAAHILASRKQRVSAWTGKGNKGHFYQDPTSSQIQLPNRTFSKMLP